MIFLQIQSKHKDLYSAVLVPNNVEQTLSNSAALNRAVKNQRECVLQLFEFSVKEILNGRCTGEEYRNPKYSQMDRCKQDPKFHNIIFNVQNTNQTHSADNNHENLKSMGKGNQQTPVIVAICKHLLVF